MQPGLHFVDQHQGVLQARNVLGKTQDGAFTGGHMELGVACFPFAIHFGEQQVASSGADDRKAPIPPRQDAVRKDQQLLRQFLGHKVLFRQPPQGAHIRRVGEVRHRAQMERAGRSLPGLPPCAAASPLPSHDLAGAAMQKVELQRRIVQSVPKRGALACEVREQIAWVQVPPETRRIPVRAGAGEQQGGFAAAVGAGQDADGVGKTHLQVGDASQLLDAHRPQDSGALPALGRQCVPNLLQLLVYERHVSELFTFRCFTWAIGVPATAG